MLEALLDKLETYGFTCEAGPLTGCVDWQKLRVACLLAAPVRTLAAEPPSEPDLTLAYMAGYEKGKDTGIVLERNRVAAEPQSEPVAWVNVPEGEQLAAEFSGYSFHGIKQVQPGKHRLYLHPSPAQTPLTATEPQGEPSTWCPIHQHYKPCEHNGGVMGPSGWRFPDDPEAQAQAD